MIKGPGFVSQATGKKYDFSIITKIEKVEEQSDGTLHVYGLVTAQRPDLDKEVCNYAKTKKNYQKRADEMLKTTDVPGMEQSLMPLREMHQLIAAGKGTAIDYDDPARTIKMAFDVVNPSSITKVKKGVLPCFSQGGNYDGALVPSTEFPGYMEYVADPGEVSLVDRGCLPGAAIESMKGQSFPLTKRDGSIELVKLDLGAPNATNLAKLDDAEITRIAEALRKSLTVEKDAKTKRKGGKDLPASAFAYVGDANDPSTWKLPIHDAAHCRNALARFNQTKGIPADEKAKVKAKILAACKQHGVTVADEAEKINRAIEYLKAGVSGTPLAKSLYDVREMAIVLQTISWIQQSAIDERIYEGDASTQPEDLETLLNDAIACFVSMVEEETEELAARAAAIKGATKTMTQDELNKAAADILEKAKSAKAHLTALQSHVTKMGTQHASHIATAHGHIGKCMKALSGEPAGENEPGEESENIDPTAGAPHTVPGSEKAYVSIGKTKDGVEIFKLAPVDPNVALLAKMQEMIDKNTENVVKAIVASFTDAPIEKAAGIGDRELVVTRKNAPMATEPVTKTADALNKGAGAGGNGNTAADEAVTPEDVRKANNGDINARLKLARLGKRATQEEATRMDENLSTMVRR